MSNKVLVYIRVSSENQEGLPAGHSSLESQEADCLAYRKSNGYLTSDIQIFQDVCSARNMSKMPMFQKMMRYLKRDLAKNVVFYNITRFSRNTLQGLTYLKQFREMGVRVFSIAENCGYQCTAERHLFRSTMSVAENESDMISDRVKRSVAFRRSMGSEIGRPPYGKEAYRTSEGVRLFRKCPHEYHMIVKMLDLYHNHDQGTTVIAQYLNKQGTFNRQGNPWTTGSIRYYLDENDNMSLRKIRNVLSELEAEMTDESDEEEDFSDEEEMDHEEGPRRKKARSSSDDDEFDANHRQYATQTRKRKRVKKRSAEF